LPRGWDGIISRNINRKVSVRIARLILKIKSDVSPNKLTILSTATGLLSGLSFAVGIPLLGGLFSQLANIMDGVDGDVARISGRVSDLGSFLDAVTDRVADASIIIGATIYLVLAYSDLSPTMAILIGCITLASSMLVSYSRLRAEHDLGIIYKTGVAGMLANRDVRLFVIMVGGILEQFLRYSLLITFSVLATACMVTVASRIYIAIKIGNQKE
jgi:phosphatidylglycerophosphate synthase